MQLTTHLTFPGTCEEAFRFYERVLGGRIQAIVHYAGSPAAADVGAQFRDKVVHATLTLDRFQLAGADVEHHVRPQGFYVLFGASTKADAERIFAQLADGGDVKLPMQPTFWSDAFGALVDRYGTPWEITIG